MEKLKTADWRELSESEIQTLLRENPQITMEDIQFMIEMEKRSEETERTMCAYPL